MVLQAAQNLSGARCPILLNDGVKGFHPLRLIFLQHFLQFDELRAVIRHDLISHAYTSHAYTSRETVSGIERGLDPLGMHFKLGKVRHTTSMHLQVNPICARQNMKMQVKNGLSSCLAV